MFGDNCEELSHRIEIECDLEWLSDPIEEKSQGQERRCDCVGINKEAVRRWLVDELLDQDSKRDDAGDEADGAEDDVERGEVHSSFSESRF